MAARIVMNERSFAIHHSSQKRLIIMFTSVRLALVFASLAFGCNAWSTPDVHFDQLEVSTAGSPVSFDFIESPLKLEPLGVAKTCSCIDGWVMPSTVKCATAQCTNLCSHGGHIGPRC